jgi:hypothetical protein
MWISYQRAKGRTMRLWSQASHAEQPGALPG